MRLLRRALLGLSLLLPLFASGLATAATATAPIPSDFNLQVSPSPLVTTVKPGTKSTVDLKVHNSSSGTENLQIQPRAFKYDSKTGNVTLEDTAPEVISSWMTFSAQKFSVLSDQTFTQTVTFNVPKDAGFSYSFALVISRQAQPKPQGSEQIIAGSLAVFTLVNVDRPGAKSSLQVTSFTASKKVYEYLPTTFTIRFNNDGNTIVQPSGNIFIERSSSDKTALGTLPVNAKQGYILPSSSRVVSSEWNDGFPVYQTVTGADGKETTKLVWNWGQLSKLRIGRYTAHLVAVYNQAGRDVPIEGTVSFWVIPWKILLVLLLVVLLILFALFMLVRMIFRFIKKKRAKRSEKKQTPQEQKPESKDK
jgi:hypothetical protein